MSGRRNHHARSARPHEPEGVLFDDPELSEVDPDDVDGDAEISPLLLDDELSGIDDFDELEDEMLPISRRRQRGYRDFDDWN